MATVTLSGIRNHSQLRELMTSLLRGSSVKKMGAATVVTESKFAGALVNVTKNGKVSAAPFAGSIVGFFAQWGAMLLGLVCMSLALKPIYLAKMFGADSVSNIWIWRFLFIGIAGGCMSASLLILKKQQTLAKNVISSLQDFKNATSGSES